MIRLGTAARALAASLVLLAGQAPAQDQTKANVLSIGGSVTEIVVALGQGHRLIARDSTSTYPPEITDLPDVGYMRALSPEGVLAVGPEMILSEEGAGPVEALDVIRAADVTFVEVPDAMDADGIIRKIEVVGKALDVPEKADTLIAEVRAALDTALEDATRPEAERKKVMFALSTQGGRITAGGQNTEADAIIRMAGGRNVMVDFEGYKQVTDEAVGLAAPDVILMMDRGGDHGAADDELFAMPSISLTPAAETRSAVRMNGLLLLGFGPRTADAIAELNAALYGDN
ncbi:heme/hemin ABC transporter substrate-binding protein [Halovulum sp. GXIMD14793]